MDNDIRKSVSSNFQIDEGFLDYFKPGRSIKDVRMSNVVASEIGKIAQKEADLLTKLQNIVDDETEFVQNFGQEAKDATQRKYQKNAVDVLTNKSKEENELISKILDNRLEEVEEIKNDVEELENASDDKDEEETDEEGLTLKGSGGYIKVIDKGNEFSVSRKRNNEEKERTADLPKEKIGKLINYINKNSEYGLPDDSIDRVKKYLNINDEEDEGSPEGDVKPGEPIDTTGSGTPDSVGVKKDGVVVPLNLEDSDGDGKADKGKLPDGEEVEIKTISPENVQIVNDDGDATEQEVNPEVAKIIQKAEPDDSVNYEQEIGMEEEPESNDQFDEIISKIGNDDEKVDSLKQKIEDFKNDKGKIDELKRKLVDELPDWQKDDVTRVDKKREITKYVIETTLTQFIENDLDPNKTSRAAKKKILDSVAEKMKTKKQSAKVPVYGKIVDETISVIRNLITKSFDNIGVDDIQSDDPQPIKESIHKIFFPLTERRNLSLSEIFERDKKEIFLMIENNQKHRKKLSDKIKDYHNKKEKLIDSLIDLYNTYISRLKNYLSKAKEKGTQKVIQQEIDKLKKKLSNFEKLKNKSLQVVKKSQEVAQGKVSKEELEQAEEETTKKEEEAKRKVSEFEQKIGMTPEKSKKATLENVINTAADKKVPLPKELTNAIKEIAPDNLTVDRGIIRKFTKSVAPEGMVAESKKTRIQKVIKESFWMNEVATANLPEFGEVKKPKVFVFLPETTDDTPISRMLAQLAPKLGGNEFKQDEESKKYTLVDRKGNTIGTHNNKSEQEIQQLYKDAFGVETNKTYIIGFVYEIDYSTLKANVVPYETIKPGKYKKVDKSLSFDLRTLKVIPIKYVGGFKNKWNQFWNEPWDNIKTPLYTSIAVGASLLKKFAAKIGQDRYDSGQLGGGA